MQLVLELSLAGGALLHRPNSNAEDRSFGGAHPMMDLRLCQSRRTPMNKHWQPSFCRPQPSRVETYGSPDSRVPQCPDRTVDFTGFPILPRAASPDTASLENSRTGRERIRAT